VFVGYCRRQSGRPCLVRFSGSASIDPATGDVVAFGVETECDTVKVAEALLEELIWEANAEKAEEQ